MARPLLKREAEPLGPPLPPRNLLVLDDKNARGTYHYFNMDTAVARTVALPASVSMPLPTPSPSPAP